MCEFAETRVLHDERRRVPYAPKLPRQAVLVADNGGRSCKRELQVRHVDAPKVDVGGVKVVVARIVDDRGF